MYTQCPDCSTAFRVTAEVLKQAAGKVRCGGCGIAFNALEYLSEKMPEQPATTEAEAPLPELTPELRKPDERVPMAISAEQSAALLKTLDELAGSDIRIEDTGVEWRVLDDDDAADESDVDAAAGALGVDELLDESPTPVDQFLTKTPNAIDAGEIFEEASNTPGQTAVDELRFDDNTPLPDDFDLDDESSYVAERPDASEQTEFPLQAAHPRDADDSPVDMALGDPDEWADILGEFAEPPKPYVPPLDAELSALEGVLPDDGNDEEQGEKPLDMDTQFALQAEAMGIDLSGIHAVEASGAKGQQIFDASVADELELPDEPEDRPELDDSDNAAELELSDETGEAPELELMDDTGEAPELELGDQSGTAPILEGRPDDAPATALDTDEEEATRRQQLDEDEEAEEAEEPPLEFGSIETAIAELEEQSDVFDKNFFGGRADEATQIEKESGDDIVLEAAPGGDAIGPEDEPCGDDIVLDETPPTDEAETDAGTSHVVPPQSEEEQTLNLLIDQELLNMAVEDEDGFASTIVFAKQNAGESLPEDNEQPTSEDAGAGFESIIMEGEFVRTALDQEKRKADIAEAAQLAREARLAQEAEDKKAGSGSRRGLAVAAVLLLLVLVVQVLHQSREALATIPAFNETVGPLYRAIGMPLSPAWDVTGWRFEARRDLLDEESDTLTVISRIGNTSTKPLPYPLINISLTDRFEETIGTKTLDPADYLTDDLDPSKMVRPGNNFTAVMTIESPSENATGYKLQACYRQPDAKLRCHIPNFK